MSTTTGVRTSTLTLPGFDAAAPEVRLLSRLLGVMIFVAAEKARWTTIMLVNSSPISTVDASRAP